MVVSVPSIRRFRRIGAVVLGLTAACGIGIAAVDQLVIGRRIDGSSATSSSTTGQDAAHALSAHAVLADEWTDRIQRDSTWRNREWTPSSNGASRANRLQGPPQPPNWFMAPPPANPWMEPPRGQFISPFQDGGSHHKGVRGVSGYRTVCVRTCDGFFFPISFGVSEASFSRDQNTCNNACAGGKLFYYKPGSEDPEDMVDLSGQKYSKMKNADLFRTQYNEACKCKAHPWEQEALDRHRLFALEDQRRKGNRAVVAELEQLKTKARSDARESSRRRTEDRRRVNVREEAKLVTALPPVAQGSAPRSDVSRGQNVAASPAAAAVPAAMVATDAKAPQVIASPVAAAANAATVQSVTAAAAATSRGGGQLPGTSGDDPIIKAAVQPGDEVQPAGLQVAPEPAIAPEPIEVEEVAPPPKRSSRKAKRDKAVRANDAPRRENPMRSAEWARRVFNQ